MSGGLLDAGIQVLTPGWGPPGTVHAAFTLRTGGVSLSPFHSLNVGAHVGDTAIAVSENRRRIQGQLRLPAEPAWLEQVHGTEVFDLDVGEFPQGVGSDAEDSPNRSRPAADAVITRQTGNVCAVQVADCLPVLFAAQDGSAVAAAHAGWRGLAAGVLEATIRRLDIAPSRLLAWLGPAIGVDRFEVGSEVRTVFLSRDPSAAAAFTPNARGRWQCDLVALARGRLAAAGISDVSGGNWCTFTDATRFFSFRRDGRCGRMAALIWLE